MNSTSPRVQRILYVYLYCNLGGVTSVIKQRAHYLQSCGIEADGIFQIDYGGAEELKRYGLDTVEISSDLFAGVMTQLEIRRYDLIAVVDMPELTLRLLNEGVSNIVYEVHTPIDAVLRKNTNELFAGVRMTVVPSQWSKDWVCRSFPGINRTKVKVCGNIVDPDVFYPPEGPSRSADAPIVWVGKFGDYKNWPLAVQILAGYLDKHPDRSAYMVTGGRLSDNAMDQYLESLLAFGIARRIIWLHNLDYREMADLYRSIAARGGALLSCSKSESFCMVLHEAIRCGVPVVTTAAGAVSEFVVHEETGLIISEDSPTNAAKTLSRINEDHELRNRVMAGARKRLANYLPSKLADAYISALQNCESS